MTCVGWCNLAPKGWAEASDKAEPSNHMNLDWLEIDLRISCFGRRFGRDSNVQAIAQLVRKNSEICTSAKLLKRRRLAVLAIGSLGVDHLGIGFAAG